MSPMGRERVHRSEVSEMGLLVHLLEQQAVEWGRQVQQVVAWDQQVHWWVLECLL